jgi:hypothetical protein
MAPLLNVVMGSETAIAPPNIRRCRVCASTTGSLTTVTGYVSCPACRSRSASTSDAVRAQHRRGRGCLLSGGDQPLPPYGLLRDTPVPSRLVVGDPRRIVACRMAPQVLRLRPLVSRVAPPQHVQRPRLAALVAPITAVPRVRVRITDMLGNELAPAMRASGTTAPRINGIHARTLVEQVFEHRALSPRQGARHAIRADRPMCGR